MHQRVKQNYFGDRVENEEEDLCRQEDFVKTFEIFDKADTNKSGVLGESELKEFGKLMNQYRDEKYGVFIEVSKDKLEHMKGYAENDEDLKTLWMN